MLVKLTAFAYLIAAGSFFLFLFRGETFSRLPALLLLLGFFIHSLLLVSRFFQDGFAAVAVTGYALLFYGWLMVGIYLLIQLKYRLTILGGIIAPLAFLVSVSSFALGRGADDDLVGLHRRFMIGDSERDDRRRPDGHVVEHA